MPSKLPVGVPHLSRASSSAPDSGASSELESEATAAEAGRQLPHGANDLYFQRSPYLRQHAFNPVHWLPWGEQAFRLAEEGNKPIFISVGYSTCHWCHVMAREAFSDPTVAALLNDHFVSIKVDREERPDIDNLYMTYLQATAGGGGWPLSAFALPSGLPFFAGTYFPIPPFTSLLRQIARAWADPSKRSSFTSDAAHNMKLLQEMSVPSVESEVATNTAAAGTGAGVGSPQWLASLAATASASASSTLASGFDSRYGGFKSGAGPKFPRPTELRFLAGRTVSTALQVGGGGTTPAAAAAQAKSASVPFMITRAMRVQLSTLGYSSDEVKRMTPQQAHDAINKAAAEISIASKREASQSSPAPAPSTSTLYPGLDIGKVYRRITETGMLTPSPPTAASTAPKAAAASGGGERGLFAQLLASMGLPGLEPGSPSPTRDASSSSSESSEQTGGPKIFTGRIDLADLTPAEASLARAWFTQRRMAAGGIHDHIGGGWHRYSTDPMWRVPHFEKMAYDQAAVLLALCDTYSITGDVALAHAGINTCEYVLRDLCWHSDVDAGAQHGSSTGEGGIGRDQDVVMRDAGASSSFVGTSRSGTEHSRHAIIGRTAMYAAEDADSDVPVGRQGKVPVAPWIKQHEKQNMAGGNDSSGGGGGSKRIKGDVADATTASDSGNCNASGVCTVGSATNDQQQHAAGGEAAGLTHAEGAFYTWTRGEIAEALAGEEQAMVGSGVSSGAGLGLEAVGATSDSTVTSGQPPQQQTSSSTTPLLLDPHALSHLVTTHYTIDHPAFNSRRDESGAAADAAVDDGARGAPTGAGSGPGIGNCSSSSTHDPHGELYGVNVISEEGSVEATCSKLGAVGNQSASSTTFATGSDAASTALASQPSARPNLDPRTAMAALAATRYAMFKYRSNNRPRPHRDEKVLLAWNGQMMEAFCRAAVTVSNTTRADLERLIGGDVVAGMVMGQNNINNNSGSSGSGDNNDVLSPYTSLVPPVHLPSIAASASSMATPGAPDAGLQRYHCYITVAERMARYCWDHMAMPRQGSGAPVSPSSAAAQAREKQAVVAKPSPEQLMTMTMAPGVTTGGDAATAPASWTTELSRVSYIQNIQQQQDDLSSGGNSSDSATTTIIPAFLDDYTSLIAGLLALYQCGGIRYAWALEWAVRLQLRQDELFLGGRGGGGDNDAAGGTSDGRDAATGQASTVPAFYYGTRPPALAGANAEGAGGDPRILLRDVPDQDGAEPCPNAQAAANLLTMAAILQGRCAGQHRGQGGGGDGDSMLRAAGPGSALDDPSLSRQFLSRAHGLFLHFGTAMSKQGIVMPLMAMAMEAAVAMGEGKLPVVTVQWPTASNGATRASNSSATGKSEAVAVDLTRAVCFLPSCHMRAIVHRFADDGAGHSSAGSSSAIDASDADSGTSGAVMAQAQVCVHRTCLLPVSDPQQLVKQLLQVPRQAGSNIA